jgi:hypothetical protein
MRQRYFLPIIEENRNYPPNKISIFALLMCMVIAATSLVFYSPESGPVLGREVEIIGPAFDGS